MNGVKPETVTAVSFRGLTVVYWFVRYTNSHQAGFGPDAATISGQKELTLFLFRSISISIPTYPVSLY